MYAMDETSLVSKLNSSALNENWDELSRYLIPKRFASIKPRELFKPLAKIAELLTLEPSNIPDSVKILFLKCLVNSCLDCYINSEYKVNNFEKGKYSNWLYRLLSTDQEILGNFNDFPYSGVAEWAVDHTIKLSSNYDTLNMDQVEILRLNIQFLCNLFTFGCSDKVILDLKDTYKCLNNANFKKAIMQCSHSEYSQLSRAACIYIHNALTGMEYRYFSEDDEKYLCLHFLRPAKTLECPRKSLLLLLNRPNVLRSMYENVEMEEKLFLLEIIFSEIHECVYNSNNHDFIPSRCLLGFITNKFCTKSDLILKVSDSYVNTMEPKEIVILLDILGLLTLDETEKFRFLPKATGVLINCTYLLKSMHSLGKEYDNYFTTVQKLSDIAPSFQKMTASESCCSETRGTSRKPDFQDHPAFGFKANLIRVIGNLVYRNKKHQNVINNIDGIPVLLDCCNIDAKNPLIMQWAILALRNLCENHPLNQETIKQYTKIKVVNNALLNEMGITLHDSEDGQSIGIMPMPQEFMVLEKKFIPRVVTSGR